MSLVFSPKRMRHTLHHRRFSFMRDLMQLLPEIHVYQAAEILPSRPRQQPLSR